MRFLSLLLVTVLCCCKASSPSHQNENTLQKLIETEIGVNATMEKNNSSSFVFAYKTNNRSVQYVAVRLADLKVVVKDKIEGSVSWNKEMEIKVIRTPGIVKINSKPEDNIQYIDLNKFILNKQ